MTYSDHDIDVLYVQFTQTMRRDLWEKYKLLPRERKDFLFNLWKANRAK